MRLLLLLTLLLPVHLSGWGQTWPLKVMTFNIRYANPDDGAYRWEFRIPLVANVLQRESPAIVGFQEVLVSQYHDLANMLKGYGRAGVGRDDGKESGEFAPIFYDAMRFTLKREGHFWLSETPEVAGSRSWDAACTRMVTWVKLKDHDSGRTLFVFNTHFDHVGKKARIESARLLLAAIEQLAGDEWVIVTGDFNDTEGSSSYQILTTTPPSNPLINTRRISRNEPVGPAYTFIGFPFNPASDQVIDFIFTRNSRGVVVKSHCIDDFHQGEHYPSDHLPVVTQFEIGKKRKK